MGGKQDLQGEWEGQAGSAGVTGEMAGQAASVIGWGAGRICRSDGGVSRICGEMGQQM